MNHAEELQQDSIKRGLWMRGYSVKDVSRLGVGFDLLVEEKYRVEVKSSHIRGGKHWGISNVLPGKFDVLAVVIEAPLSTRKEVYYLKDKATLADLIKNEVGERIKTITITKERIEEYFTNRPQEVFGKPKRSKH